MFEGFTPEAISAVAHAQQEVFQLSHDAIGPEHLLLGILYVMDPVAIHALETHGLTYASARTTVAQVVGAGTRDSNTVPPFTPGAKETVARAARKVDRDESIDPVSLEQLLLAVLDATESNVPAVMVKLDIDPIALRAEVHRRANPA